MRSSERNSDRSVCRREHGLWIRLTARRSLRNPIRIGVSIWRFGSKSELNLRWLLLLRWACAGGHSEVKARSKLFGPRSKPARGCFECQLPVTLMVVWLPARRRQPGLAYRQVAVLPLGARSRSLNWSAGRSMGLLPRDIICGTTHHGFCSCKSPEGSSRIEKVPSPAIVAAGFTRTIIYTVILSNHLAIRASPPSSDGFKHAAEDGSSELAHRARLGPGSDRRGDAQRPAPGVHPPRLALTDDLVQKVPPGGDGVNENPYSESREHTPR